MDVMRGSNSPIDMKQLMFNNFQLLGLDAQAMEATNHIPFNKLMFDLPNKRGAEIVLHFLFQKLNPTMCKEAFRDSWPIHDKKSEQTFRKTCSNWLTNIAKNDPDCHLPRINASLFMSPGGDKFYQLLFHFSSYVLKKTLEKDLGPFCSEILKYPSLTSQNLQLGEVMKKNMVCSSVRHRNGFFSTPQLTLNANTIWRETADEMVKENRKMRKEIRELDYNIREEEQTAVQTGLLRGSPVKSRGNLEQFDPNFDPRTIKRAQKIQQVRDMWKQLDDFEHSEAAEREVVESIVEHTFNKHRIDAADISIKVPEMLLRECADEIRRRNVDNTYQCGKLNLISVVQLWNLSLHLYLEKLKQVGVPKFENEVQKLGSQLRTQQKYLQNAQDLGEQMQEKIPELKSFVNDLRGRLDEMFFKDMTPTSIRSTSLGYGLVEPSPQPTFSPEHGQTPEGGIGIPRDTQQVETPDAVAMIAKDIEFRVRQGPAQLFNGVDIQLNPLTADRNNSSIPKPSASISSKKSSQPSSRHSSRPSSAASRSSSKRSTRSDRSTPKASPRIEKEVFPSVSNPRTLMDSYRSTGHSPRRSPGVSPRVVHSPLDSGRQTDGQPGRLTPTDYLVEEIMGESEVLTNCTSGLEAFKSHDRVVRTPDLVEDDKENIEPDKTLTDTALVIKTKEIETADWTEGEDQLTADDIHRLDLELSERQRDTGEIEILGPELEEEYDNEDTEVSEEKLLVIDRSMNLLQEEGVPDDLLSFQSPGISSRQFDDEFSSHSPQPIVIDKSLKLSPWQKEKLERSGSSGSPTISPRYQPMHPEAAGSQLSGSSTSPRVSLQYQPGSPEAAGSLFSASSTSPRVSPRYQPDSKEAAGSQLPETPTRAQIIQGSPARKEELLRQKLGGVLRSPLSEEIRKMYKEAIGDTTARRSQDTTESHSLKKSLSGSSRNSFVDQVQLEGLVVGENIERRDSEYFARSGYLAHQFKQLNSDGTQSPKVNDILKRMKAMEERMLGMGTPLGSSSDLELPVMDPNSRIPDSDEDDGAPVQKGDISWELTENLEDIEMPDLDIGEDLENGDDVGNATNNGKQEEADLKIELDFKPVNLDDFFDSKTPQLPTRAVGLQSESLQSTDSNAQIPKFPQLQAEDESPLITFTP